MSGANDRELTAFYEAIAPCYDEDYAGVMPESIAFYTRLAQQYRAVPAGGPVLEMGCGTGRVLLPIARAGIAVHGMDWSAPMLEQLRARLAREPEPVARRVAITHGDIRCADAGARFPLVIAAANVPHSFLDRADQRAWLRNARRHLLPGGSLCFDVFQPNFKILTANPDEIIQVIDRVNAQTGNRVRRYTRCEQEPEFQRFRVVMRWVEEDAAGNVVAESSASCMQRWYTNAELENLLELEGLRMAECWGGFTGEPFAKGATEQIVRAVAMGG